MHRLIKEHWYNRDRKKNQFLSFLLLTLSEIYKGGLFIREFFLKNRRVERVPIPVVSVGNLSVGGEGKTPLVMKIASFFIESGFRPAVITRGYRRKRRGVFSVNIDEDDPRTCGDEPYLLARNLKCPVVVGRKRKEAIKKAIDDYGVNVAILDDGFQVRTLKKDVEIVVIKTTRNSLNFDLFPFGPMREPIENIRRSDLIVLNEGLRKNQFFDFPQSLSGSIPLFRSWFKVLNLCNIRSGIYKDYNQLRGMEVVAFSGLGDNDSFFNLLADIGAKIKVTVSFPDHHFYTKRDIKRITREKAEIYVTTEKDAVKLERLHVPDTFYYLTVHMAIEKEKEFFSTILNLIEKKVTEKNYGRESLYL